MGLLKKHRIHKIAFYTHQNGFNKKETVTSVGGCGEIETFIHCWCECKAMQQLWKIVWQFFKMLKIVTIAPSNSTTWCLPKRNETRGPHKNLNINV